MNIAFPALAATLVSTFSFQTLAATDAGMSATNRVIHARWAPKVIELKPDDVTTIMGYRAELRGHLTHQPMPEPKFYAKPGMYGFVDDGDRMVF